MEFSVQILGTSSALPIYERFPTSQYVRVGDFHILIDCGEGTQIQLNKYGIKRNRIDHIFISHLHGDHVYGLPGLLGSYNHFNRTHPLHIYGPNGLKKFIHMSVEITGAKFGYSIQIEELPEGEQGSLQLGTDVTVSYFPLKHRIPNLGYRIDWQPVKKKINKEAISKYNLEISQIRAAVSGEDITMPDGEKIPNHLITLPQPERISYAFCSDTVYDPGLAEYIKGVDLLYHETTYLSGLEKEAKERMHSTLGQAINISRMAGAGRLLTGHYSSRYRDLEPFREEASNVGIPVIIGQEGEIYLVSNRL